MLELRPYQKDSVENVRNSYRSGKNKPLLVLPTGGGKTICFSHITHHASAKGNRVMIIVHRQELLDQCHLSLVSIGVEHGIIASGRTQDNTKNVQIASIQTLVRRIDKIPQPDLIILDEAHHACAGSWQKVLNRWSSSRVLGVTATPARLDGKGLNSVFDDIIIGPQVTQLIKDGYLCNPVYYAPATIDLSGVKTTAGDYNKKEVNDRMDKPTITGDAVEHYRRLANNLPTVVFCSSLKHAKNVCEAFIQAGYPSGILDGTLSDHDRRKRVRDLATGEIKILVTVDIVSEGFDLPLVSVAILLRPTQSLSLHLQQIGRVLRVSPGKDRAIILDHVGNCIRHGLAEEEREWTLDGIKKKPKSANKNESPRYLQCPKCYIIHKPADKCENCGHIREIKERVPEQVSGTLEQINIDPEKLRQMRVKNMQQGRAQSLGQLIALGKSRGMKNPVGWANHVYKARLRKP